MQQATQTMMEPLMKWTQANMELITQFTTSPEVLDQSVTNLQNLMQQAQKSAVSLAQSNAVSQLTQGLLRNYTDFIAELGRTSMAALAQGQADIAQRAQEVTHNVIETTIQRSKRAA